MFLSTSSFTEEFKDPSRFYSQFEKAHVGAHNTAVDVPPPYSAEQGDESLRKDGLNSPTNMSYGHRHDAGNAVNTIASRVNNISIFSKHNPIVGTYFIDPLLPAAKHGGKGIFSNINVRKIQREHARNTGREGDDKPEWDYGRKNTPAPNAAFRTRHGDIALNIAVVGTDGPNLKMEGISSGAKAKGNIMTFSRHGHIQVNLFKVDIGHRVNLSASSRRGNIVILLPPTYNGSISIRTRNGREGIKYLPAFAERAIISHLTDREAVISLVSQQPGGTHGTTGDDSCVIGTRHGKIVIGISGIDEMPRTPEDGGLLKEIGGFVQVLLLGHK